MNKEINERKHSMNRRAFLAKSAIGIGSAALVSMFGCSGGENREAGEMIRKIGGALGDMNFAPKAKRVIYLFQSGGPSQLELFDYKPLLNEKRGQDLPEEIRMGLWSR